MENANNDYFNVILIDVNDFMFDIKSYYNNKHQLANDLGKYTKCITVNIQNMMGAIVNEIDLTAELIGHCPIFYETATNIYQVCYKGDDSKIKIQNNVTDELENKICSYLVGEKIYGKAVIINSLILPSNTCTTADVTINEMVDILYSKFFHKGICVSANVNDIAHVIEFDYSSHPLEFYNIKDESEFDNYKILDVEFMGFSLCMVIEIKPKNDVVNKIATRIYGTNKINGDVLIISKSTHEYYDLTHPIFNKINSLSFGHLSSRQLFDFEKPKNEMDNMESNEEQQTGGLPYVTNKYLVLNRRYEKITNICKTCSKPLNASSLTCTGCYRIRYDCQECQKIDWNNGHKNECLYKKDSINGDFCINK